MILGDEGKTPMTVPDRTTCRNPATGEILGHSALNSIGLVGQAFGRARQVQPAWSQRPVRERVRYLNRVRAYIAENADELAEIISRDNGKTRTDALASEVLPAAMAVDYYCRNAVAFLKDRRIRPGNLLMANKVSRIIRVPYGVVGIISPWNYPFSIPFSEVVMALLAGNAVLLKVATETQLVGRAIERCLAAAGLPEGLFAYLNLPGRIAGTALLEAGVDKLFFTGSVAVGQTLMAEASPAVHSSWFMVLGKIFLILRSCFLLEIFILARPVRARMGRFRQFRRCFNLRNPRHLRAQVSFISIKSEL
jgi:acyl-CoA reductase-like NAD-dependent aldehyde dehydrogenase